MRLQHALNSIDGAADDGDFVRGDVIAFERPPREVHQLRVIRFLAVELMRAGNLREDRRQRRQQLRIGIAVSEVDCALRCDRQSRRRQGRPPIDDSAAPSPGSHQPAYPQRAIGRSDRGRADFEAIGQRSNCRQHGSGRQPATTDLFLDAGGNLVARLPANLIRMCCHIHYFVLLHKDGANGRDQADAPHHRQPDA